MKLAVAICVLIFLLAAGCSDSYYQPAPFYPYWQMAPPIYYDYSQFYTPIDFNRLEQQAYYEAMNRQRINDILGID